MNENAPLMLFRQAKLATRWGFGVGWAMVLLCAQANGQTPLPNEGGQTEVCSSCVEPGVSSPLTAASFDSCVGAPFASTRDQRAWQKGGFRIVPYGAFWGDMIYATERTEPGAFTLFVLSPEQDGEDAFVIDARRTRLGADVSGPKIGALGNAASGGRVEIDFHGNFVTENRANVLLRQAYWEVKNERFRLLVGQTSDVISPLIPGTLNYSVGWTGGNIGFRRTQFRGERYWAASDRFLLTVQGALSQDIVADFPNDPGVRRETSNWPIVQTRAACTWGPRDNGADPLTFGCSGHIGETGFDFLTAGPPPLNLPPENDARFLSWSFNLDLHAPIGERTGFQGEFFTGANLSSFLGGIGQGVCPCLRVPIKSTGGWGEIWYNWTSSLQSRVGYGIDDPDNDDSLLGRISNQFLFGNLIYEVSDNLTTGIEVTYWKTRYQERRVGLIPPNQLAPSQPGESVVIDWMVKYSF